MSPANMLHIAEIRDERGEINEIKYCMHLKKILEFYFIFARVSVCVYCVYSIEYDILLTIKICSSRVLYSCDCADQTKHIVTVRH